MRCWVPAVRSAGLVLLQTVPEGLGACALRAAALRVPGVLALHELHVWQLHAHRLVATAHVLYASHEVHTLTHTLFIVNVFVRNLSIILSIINLSTV